MDTGYLKQQLRRYLEEVFSGQVVMDEHQGAAGLPLALRGLFTPLRLRVFDCAFTALLFVGGNLQQAMRYWQKPALLDSSLGDERRVLVMESLSKRQRNSCIEAGIPFVVPGAHLWLPFLGAVFDEQRGRKARLLQRQDQVQPTTQALLLRWHYHGTHGCDAPGAAAEVLGYTAMAMSRPFDEVAN
ncbi:MAG: hypothetical protein EA401_14300 [Planctomycetota bacterium]|nr:MAG: hypothetical protein EA401_14300 [Planctomycetota bacterium]